MFRSLVVAHLSSFCLFRFGSRSNSSGGKGCYARRQRQRCRTISVLCALHYHLIPSSSSATIRSHFRHIRRSKPQSQRLVRETCPDVDEKQSSTSRSQSQLLFMSLFSLLSHTETHCYGHISKTFYTGVYTTTLHLQYLKQQQSNRPCFPRHYIIHL